MDHGARVHDPDRDRDLRRLQVNTACGDPLGIDCRGIQDHTGPWIQQVRQLLDREENSFDIDVELIVKERPPSFEIETKRSRFRQKKRVTPGPLLDPSQPLIMSLDTTHQHHALMDTE